MDSRSAGIRWLLVALAPFGLCVVTRTSGAQIRTQSVARTDSIVADIDAAVAIIDGATPRFAKVEKDFEADNDGRGGSIEAFFDRGVLWRIDAVTLGGAGETEFGLTQTFYVSAGNLVMVSTATTPDRLAERWDRLYFNNGRLLRWQDQQGRSLDVTTDEARTQQQSLLSAFAKYRSAVAGETPARFLELFESDSTDIPAGSYLPYSFKIAANSKCTLVGRIVATSGGNRDVDLFLFDLDGFENFKAKRGTATGLGIYESGRRAATTLNVPTPGPKNYTFVVSNAFSALTPKVIEGKARVRCIE